MDVFQGCGATVLNPCKPKGSSSHPGFFHDKSSSGSEAALVFIHVVQALAAALRINRVLTQLRLHGNDVGVQGAQAHEIGSNTSQDGQV